LAFRLLFLGEETTYFSTPSLLELFVSVELCSKLLSEISLKNLK